MTSFPKPARRKREAVKLYPDGREVIDQTTAEGRREYERRILFMHHRDGGLCCLCGRYVALGVATFEHKEGRGVGGGKRDDRAEKNGIAHFLGNRQKGSVGYGEYMKKPLEWRIKACMGVL
jgi:hypothetical protein